MNNERKKENHQESNTRPFCCKARALTALPACSQGQIQILAAVKNDVMSSLLN